MKKPIKIMSNIEREIDCKAFNSKSIFEALVKQRLIAYAKKLKDSKEQQFTVKQAITIIRFRSNPLIKQSAESFIRRCLNNLVKDEYLNSKPGIGRRPSYYFLGQKEAPRYYLPNTVANNSSLSKESSQSRKKELPVLVKILQRTLEKITTLEKKVAELEN